MDELSTRSLTIALIFVVVPLLLRAMGGGAGAGGAARLRYSKGARFFGALGSAALLAMATGGLLQPGPLKSGDYPAAVSVLLIAMMGMGMSLEFFRVNHEYGAAGVSYRSPWSRARHIEWKDVAAIEWRPTLKWLDLVPNDGGPPLHFSPLLGGLAPFAAIALETLPSRAVDQNIEARAALHLMAAGHGSMLLFSSKHPSEVCAELDRIRNPT